VRTPSHWHNARERARANRRTRGGLAGSAPGQHLPDRAHVVHGRECGPQATRREAARANGAGAGAGTCRIAAKLRRDGGPTGDADATSARERDAGRTADAEVNGGMRRPGNLPDGSQVATVAMPGIEARSQNTTVPRSGANASWQQRGVATRVGHIADGPGCFVELIRIDISKCSRVPSRFLRCPSCRNQDLRQVIVFRKAIGLRSNLLGHNLYDALQDFAPIGTVRHGIRVSICIILLLGN